MPIRSLIKPLLWTSIPVGLACLFLAPIFSHARAGAYRTTCQSNLKQMAWAYNFYVQDSDQTSPPVSNGKQGWASLLQPYAKTWATFQCPAGQKTSESNRTDYFYNARVAKTKNDKLPFRANTILFGDGYDNSGANAHLSELPLDWKSDENSVERRHLTGQNFAFVDGHVKFIRPEKVSIHSPSSVGRDWEATFAVR